MNGARFDTLFAALSGARSRRQMLAALAAAALPVAAGAASMRAGDVTAEACLRRGERCKRKRECCSEQCRSRDGGKKRKCRCSPEGKRCVETNDCCPTGVPLLCVSGFCIRDR